VDIAYGGSCTGGKREDFDRYHEVLSWALGHGLRVQPGVQLFLQFGTTAVRDYCVEKGYLEVFERAGADAMRWFRMASPILRGGNLVVTEQGIREGVRQAILPLWNTWYFLSLYANAAGRVGRVRTDSTHVLDRYVLAKTAALVDGVTAALEVHDIAGACEQVRDHAEVLTNWYVRRSRGRFWDGDADAIDTLHTVLEATARVAAPLLPLAMERVWQGLTGGRSVHLTDWPTTGELPHDDALVAAMDRVRQVASAALSLRKARGLRVRLPLHRLTVAAAGAASLEPFADILRDEVNVKDVVLTDEVAAFGRFEVAVNARACGPRLGGDTQKVIRAVKAGEWTTNPDGTVEEGWIALLPGEFTERLVAADPSGTAALPGNSGLVVLDTTVTPELAREGLGRDVVRLVQQARRDAGLEVSDRITLTLDAPEQVVDAVQEHETFVAGEVLATSVAYAPVPEPTLVGAVSDGHEVRVLVTPAAR